MSPFHSRHWLQALAKSHWLRKEKKKQFSSYKAHSYALVPAFHTDWLEWELWGQNRACWTWGTTVRKTSCLFSLLYAQGQGHIPKRSKTPLTFLSWHTCNRQPTWSSQQTPTSARALNGASDPNLKPWARPESGHTAPPPLLPRAPPHPGFHSDCCAFRVLQLPYRSTWRFPFLYYAWDPRHSRIRRLEVFIIFGKLQPYLQPNPMKFSIYASSYFLYVLLELTGFLLDTVILTLLKVSFIVSYSLLLSRQFLQLHLSAH